MCKSAEQLICASDKRLFAIKANDRGRELEVLWDKTLDSRPRTALVADERLFVVTDAGTIHCLRGEAGPAKNYPEDASPPTHGGQSIVKSLPAELVTDRGYGIMVAGNRPESSPSSLVGIVQESELYWVILERDEDRAAALRAELDAHQLHGRRATVLLAADAGSQLPPYLARWIIVLGSPYAEEGLFGAVQQLYGSLRPYGGRMLVRMRSIGSSTHSSYGHMVCWSTGITS